MPVRIRSGTPNNMSNEDIEVEDYIRWLGSRKPVAFAWYGLAILEIAAAIFILTKAYVIYDTEIEDSLSTQELIELVREK